MKLFAGILLALAALLSAAPVYAISNFQHIIIVIEENRTPDNLFMGMCRGFGGTAKCSTTDPNQYDIQTSAWLDKNNAGGTIAPVKLPLGIDFDPVHGHRDFEFMCDGPKKARGPCRMDGANNENCTGACNDPVQFPFYYVDPAEDEVATYYTLATSYGWDNHFYQTNQGPSWPAHQFLFGATSAPSAADDAAGTFVAENMNCGLNEDGGPHAKGCGNGCIVSIGSMIRTIDKNGVEKGLTDPCTEHQTISDLLDSNSLTWNYYTPLEGSLWTAPLGIFHICGVDGSKDGSTDCLPGSIFKNHVRINAEHTLISDIAQCALPAVSWVVPQGQDSDHAGNPLNVGGPDWVATVVNAIGGSNCTDGASGIYWQNTAIVVTWDDWGGWYDHEPPTILGSPEGGYQLGFRVPMIFVSAYTPKGYIDGLYSADFGDIANFVEKNFGIAEGSLGFADARAYKRSSPADLRQFYNLNNPPRTFVQIPARRDAKWFMNDRSPPTPPDDD